VGTHAITATYVGDGNFTSSVSAIIAEVVKVSAKITAASSTPTSGNRNVAPITSIQTSLVRGLNDQSVDDFFTSSAGQRPVHALIGVLPRRLIPKEDWLGTSV
jgi:hypothetical protein